MSEFKLIMISAWHEQGGNVFQRHLDGHPNLFVYPFESQIATPYSSSIIDESFVPNRYRYPEFLSEMSPIELYQSIWDQELKTLLRTPHLSKFRDCGLKMSETNRIACFKIILAELMDEPISVSRPKVLEAFFRSTFMSWENYNTSGKETAYVGYSPPILFNADKFFHDFPNGKMIHVIRNPYSGYADTKKRPFPMSLTKYCRIWSLAQLEAMNLLMKYPKNFFVVHYEDMMGNDKSKEMKKISEKLEIEYSDTMLYPSFNGQKLESVYPWGTIIKADEQTNINTALELSIRESAQIEKETGYIGERLGYSKELFLNA